MPADHAPHLAVFARPYSSVAICSARDISGDIHCKLSKKRRDRYIRTDTADAKLFRNVSKKLDST